MTIINQSLPTVTPVKSDMELLSEGADDNKKVNANEKPDEEVEIPPDEEVEDGKDETDESEGKESEDEELAASVPDLNQLNKQYPDLFKKYPVIREALVASRKFTEIFPTPELAQEAADALPILQAFENDIASGNSKTLLSSISKNFPETANKFAENLLPTLLETDKSLYVRATAPFLAGVLSNIRIKAEEAKDTNLVNSTKLLAKYLYGSYDIPKFEREQANPERAKLDQERSSIAAERYQEFSTSIVEEGKDIIEGLIAKDLDPDAVLPDFIRETIIEKTFDEINEMLTNDRSHQATMRALRESISKTLNDRTTWRQSRARIINAVLVKAKNLIPAVRRRYLNEALSKLGRQPRKETRVVDKGGVSRSKSNKVTAEEARSKGMSSMDVIMAGVKD